MKKLIAVLLLLSSASIFACECTESSYDQNTAESAAKSFLQNKFNVEPGEIVQFETTGSEQLRTKMQNGLIAVLSLGGLDDQNLCEMNCLGDMHRVYTQKVEYKKDGKVCSLDIATKMYSKLFFAGYKSVVTSTEYPVCE